MTELLLEPIDDDEFTELSGAVIPRLDLVKSGANGMPFLIAKGDAAGGVFTPDQVRGLIADVEVPVAKAEQVTLSGSAAAIAAMIHQAPVRKARPGTTTEQEGAPMGDDVTKADVPEGDEPLPSAEEVLEDAKAEATGDPSDPSSPAWEAVDAANAQKAIELTVALRRMICAAQDREGVEAALSGDMGDVENAMDLGAALSAVDCIISILAPFAVTEQAEAEERQADLDGVSKGQGVGMVDVAKAGRVLSSQNEQKISAAVESLQSVLASLPAPVTDDGAGPVAKSEEPNMEDTETSIPIPEAMTDGAAAEQAPVANPGQVDEVAKAKGDPQVAVYTADGKLVGTVDQADLNPIAAPAAPEGGDAQGADGAEGSPAEEAAETPAEEAAEPADPDDGAKIPGTETIAAPAPAEDDAVTKAVQAGLGSLLADALAPVVEELSKHAELASVVKGMQEQIEHLAAMPDDRKSPRLNGATGAAGVAARDGSEVDKLADLKKAVAEATDPVKKFAAEASLANAAILARFAR